MQLLIPQSKQELLEVYIPDGHSEQEMLFTNIQFSKQVLHVSELAQTLHPVTEQETQLIKSSP